MAEKKIIPVLLGGDLNAYGVAYSFYRIYGLKSAVFSRMRLGITDNSEFIELHIHEGLDDFNIAVPLLLDFASERADAELILVPCADWYMEMLEYARTKLCGHFYFNIPEFEIWQSVSDKASFYKLLERFSVSYPKFVADDGISSLEAKAGKLKPPFVLKPSDSVEYWKHKFVGMKKVYFPLDLSEAQRTAELIRSSGYSKALILQERISGDNVTASVLTTYSNSKGRVVRAVLGDIVLEEKGNTARGNYSAIIVRQKNAFCDKLINMLNSIGYTGFANFDILTKEGESFCLELNPRQGRSSDCLRSCGVDMSFLLMNDFSGNTVKENFSVKEALWLAVPISIVKRYAESGALKQEALMLYKSGRYTSVYKISDKPKRRIVYNFLHSIKQRMNFKRYEKEVED